MKGKRQNGAQRYIIRQHELRVKFPPPGQKPKNDLKAGNADARSKRHVKRRDSGESPRVGARVCGQPGPKTKLSQVDIGGWIQHHANGQQILPNELIEV